VQRGLDTERGLPLRVERTALGEEAGAVELDVLAQAEGVVLLHEVHRLGTGVEHVDALRPGAAHLAQVGLPVGGRAERRECLAGDLAAGCGERLLEAGDRLLARGVVGRHQVDRVTAELLGHCGAECLGDLSVGERGAPDVRRGGRGQLVGPRVGDDQRHLGLDEGVLEAESRGGADDAHDGGHLVLGHQLGGRRHAGLGRLALVGLDDLDVATAELAVVLVEEELEALLHVLAERGVDTGERDGQADLDRPRVLAALGASFGEAAPTTGGEHQHRGRGQRGWRKATDTSGAGPGGECRHKVLLVIGVTEHEQYPTNFLGQSTFCRIS
jgi:hypothetical protein